MSFVNIELKRISGVLRRRRPMLFTHAKKQAEEDAPVDGVEIVSWMQKCGAINRIMSPWMNDYTDAGGYLVGMSNDAWYPGVFTRSYQIFARQTGAAVAKLGYVRVDNRYGDEVARVPPYTRAFFDNLRGLVMVSDLYSVQFNALLAEFLRHARLPFSGEMRLPAIDVAKVGYMSLPAVFRVNFIRPFARMVMRVGYEAHQPGVLKVQVWDGGNLVAEGSVKSDSGDMNAMVTVTSDRLISRSPHVVIAYDGAESGMTLYEARPIMPLAIPL